MIAVESPEKGFGRCRLQVVEKIGAVQLGEFLHRSIAPGSVVISDALRCCPLAMVEHLQAYLDEFTFRFNRRHCRARGLG